VSGAEAARKKTIMFSSKSRNTTLPARANVLPNLVSAYHEQGYEAGYARGINDALAAVLEATEGFVRLRPDSAAETRRLLHAFSEFLEEQVCLTPPHAEREFVDGLGI
jgi:hypothetical protein